MTVEKKWLTTKEVCQLLGIEESWLYALRKPGTKYYDPRFPNPTKPYGRENRYPAEEMYQYVAAKMGGESKPPSKVHEGSSPPQEPRGIRTLSKDSAPSISASQSSGASIAPDWMPRVVIDTKRHTVYITTPTGEKKGALRRPVPGLPLPGNKPGNNSAN